MAYKQQLGRDKINSFSAFEAKGLVNSPMTYGDEDDPARTVSQIKRTAAIEKVKKALTPDFSGLGGRLSKKVSQMKPGVMRNVALNVSNTLMGKKPNPSDTQLVSNRVARKEKKENQTDYSGYGVLKAQGYGGGQQGMCGKNGCLKPGT